MKGQILVVDDDAAIRRALRRIFERHGCQVIEADSLAAALDLLKVEPQPDAIVCDVLMPEGTGLDFYGLLLESAPQLRHRVIFLTGANRDPKVHLAIEELGAPLLGKLDDLELVVDAVRVALLRPLSQSAPSA